VEGKETPELVTPVPVRERLRSRVLSIPLSTELQGTTHT
jgi:hypothetical protein